ncbi:MAG: HNH endonuclease [Patescibacteria group bacterium]
MAKIYKQFCKECGKYYEGRGNKYCSRSCGKFGKLNPFFNKKHSKTAKNKISKSRIGKSTGSGKNHWNYQGKCINHKCKECKKEINYRSIYCCSCSKKGNRSNNWKGGITPFRIKIWKSNKYRIWRKKVFIRDKYICQKCGNSKCWIEAHHIKYFATYPKLRFVVSNGLTLCKKCHKNIHTGISKSKYL